MYAADRGHINVLWYLWASLEEGHWDVFGRPRSKRGHNLLTLAVLGGHLNCVRFIVEHLYEAGTSQGDTIESKISAIETAQTKQMRRSHAMMALYRGHKRVLEYLLSKRFQCAIMVQNRVAEGRSRLVYLHPNDVRNCPNEMCPWSREYLSANRKDRIGRDA